MPLPRDRQRGERRMPATHLVDRRGVRMSEFSPRTTISGTRFNASNCGHSVGIGPSSTENEPRLKS